MVRSCEVLGPGVIREREPWPGVRVQSGRHLGGVLGSGLVSLHMQVLLTGKLIISRND